jgi:Phosphodiester glycosidase
MELGMSKRGASPFKRACRVGICVGLIGASIALSLPGGAAPGRSWVRKKRIAPGVMYTRLKDASGPFRIHMLSIDASRPSTLDVVLSNDRLPGSETTSSMARRSGAIAAVNGDYAVGTGRPVYDFARDGSLDQTTEQWGRNFSLDTTETLSYIGHPRTKVWLRNLSTGSLHAIDSVNQGDPAVDEVAMFTPSAEEDAKPPRQACSARLLPSEGPVLRTADPGVDSTFLVDKVVCAGYRLKRRGGVVLSTPSVGPRTIEITSMQPGQQITVTWTLGWMGVFDTIGGNPTLMEDGGIVWKNFEGDSPFLRRNPRTGVATTGNGRVLLVAVDGRRPRYSVGMSLREFAMFFRDQGAEWALNLDGGGSTTFWVKGDVKNRPSDGPERPVSSSIVLLRGSDPGEGSAGILSAAGAATSAGGVEDAVEDPASTGGLASYLEEKGADLTPALHRAAEKFEASR